MLVGPQVEEVRVIEERSFNLSCRVSVPASIDSKVRTARPSNTMQWSQLRSRTFDTSSCTSSLDLSNSLNLRSFDFMRIRGSCITQVLEGGILI